MTTRLTATLPDGREVLVTLWDATSGELAFRDPQTHRWGVPTTLEVAA